MMRSWQVQEAKNKFSQVVNDAVQEGPQIITKRGVEVAVVLSSAEYRKLIGSQQKLSEFFQQSPLVGVELDLTRDTSEIRTEFTP